MNCTQCFDLPDYLRQCQAYPGGWPGCGGYIAVSGQPKHEDQQDPRQGEKLQAEYIANLRRMGYKL